MVSQLMSAIICQILISLQASKEEMLIPQVPYTTLVKKCLTEDATPHDTLDMLRDVPHILDTDVTAHATEGLTNALQTKYASLTRR